MRFPSFLMPASCLFALILLACSSAPPPKDEVDERKTRAAEYTQFGNAHFTQGDYDQALSFFTLALNDNLSVDNRKGVIQSYNSIGRVYLAQGETEAAERTFRLAMDLAYRLQDPFPIAQSLNNLGEVYLVREDPRKALSLFQEAFSQAPAGSLGDLDAILHHNTGSAYKKMGQWPEALSHLQGAAEANLQRKRFAEAASSFYMIASIYSKQGDFSAGLQAAESALHYDKMIESSPGIAKDLIALGLLHQRMGNAEAAYDCFLRSYSIYQTLGSESETRKALAYLASVAEKAGKAEEARRLLEAVKAREKS